MLPHTVDMFHLVPNQELFRHIIKSLALSSVKEEVECEKHLDPDLCLVSFTTAVGLVYIKCTVYVINLLHKTLQWISGIWWWEMIVMHP